MAERRMFAKTIIDSDAFLEMPLSTQALYFHLSMRADDDGFINNPKKVMRMIGANENEIQILIMKKFIIAFETGIIVIKHWKIHNYIAKDRYKATVYEKEKSQLQQKNNKSYTLKNTDEEKPLEISVSDECIQDVYKMDTQVRLGKARLGKDSKEKKPTFASIISTFTTNKDLQESLEAYVEMRKKTKGFTIKALQLNLNKLAKLSDDTYTQVEIVNTSVMNGWKSFYEPKGNYNNARKTVEPAYKRGEVAEGDITKTITEEEEEELMKKLRASRND